MSPAAWHEHGTGVCMSCSEFYETRKPYYRCVCERNQECVCVLISMILSRVVKSFSMYYVWYFVKCFVGFVLVYNHTWSSFYIFCRRNANYAARSADERHFNYVVSSLNEARGRGRRRRRKQGCQGRRMKNKAMEGKTIACAERRPPLLSRCSLPSF